MAEWLEFQDHDAFPSEDAATVSTVGFNYEHCKQVCVDKGFCGFVVKRSSGKAYFKSHQRNALIDKRFPSEGLTLFVAPSAGERSMTASQDPGILKPLQANLERLRTLMAEEGDEDPVPQFATSEIRDSIEWLCAAACAMQDYVDLFTAHAAQGMDRERLARYQMKGREAARRLTIMLADSQNGFANDEDNAMVMDLCRGQSSEVRQRLEHLKAFFGTFGKSEWLGSMVANADFVSKNERCIAIMEGLMQPLKLEGIKSAPCHALSLEVEGAPQLSEGEQNENGTSPIASMLEQLVAQADALAAAFRRDARIRQERSERLSEKTEALRGFATAVNEAQKALNAFLLMRADEIREADSNILKKWITRREANEAHMKLEHFRDDAMKESLRREILGLEVPRPIGTQTPMSTDGEYEKLP